MFYDKKKQVIYDGIIRYYFRKGAVRIFQMYVPEILFQGISEVNKQFVRNISTLQGIVHNHINARTGWPTHVTFWVS